MLLEVCYGGENEIWCVQGDQRVSLDPTLPLVATTPDAPTGSCVGDLYVLTWGPWKIGYLACLGDQTPPDCPGLDVLCIGGESDSLSTLADWLAILRPRYCVPLGKRATKYMPQRSQQVMATGHTFPKLLRPGQAVVLQHI